MQQFLREHPEARNYRCDGGPLERTMLPGLPGWRIYCVQDPDGPGAMHALFVAEGEVAGADELAAGLSDLAEAGSPYPVGYYTLDTDAPGYPVWRWTAWREPWR